MTEVLPELNTFLIATHILNALFDPDRRRLHKVLDSVVTRNKQLNHIQIDGFSFNGRYYMSSVAGKSGKLLPLHESLEPEMEEYTADELIIMNDTNLIRQAIHQACNICIIEQHYRDTLPDCVTNLVPSLKHLPREQEVGYTIKNNERLYRQYMDVIPKMELYSALGLFC